MTRVDLRALRLLVVAAVCGTMTAGFLACPADAQRTSLTPIPGMRCVFQMDNSVVTAGYYECYGTPGQAADPLPDVWGAIAISPALQTSYSYQFRSQALAETAAIDDCRTRYKQPSCKVLVAFEDICAAVAVSAPERIVKISKPTPVVNWAEAKVLQDCRAAGGKACMVAASHCADHVRHEAPLETCFTGTGNPVACNSSRPLGRR